MVDYDTLGLRSDAISTVADQHTPGPWEWRFSGTMGRWALVSVATGEMVHVGGPPDVALTPDQELTAKAPEMFDVLRAIIINARENIGVCIYKGSQAYQIINALVEEAPR